MELGMVRFLPSVKPGRFKRVFQAGARLGDRLAIEFNRPKENETPIAELWRLTKTPEAEPPRTKTKTSARMRKSGNVSPKRTRRLQARIAALESVCRRLIEIDDGVYELPDLAIKVLARSCRKMLGNKTEMK